MLRKYYLALLALVLLSGSAAANAELRLGTQELPPYSYTNSQGQADGLAVNVVTCALAAMQEPYQIQVRPWARVQLMVQRDELDGFFAASYAQEREKYAQLSVIIAPQQWRWYLLKDSTLDPASEAFKSQARVSAYLGTNMLNWLISNQYNVQTAPARQGQLLKMLQLGRLDAVLSNHLVMEQILRESGQESSVRSVLQEDKPLGVYFSHTFLATRPGFLSRFNEQVPDCRSKAEAAGY